VSRYAPWSLAASVGFWRVWRQPAVDAAERRFGRFLFAWFGVGLIVFTIAPHKRPDLLLPIIPAAAMLAGRELARWLGRFRPATVWRGAAAFGVGTLAVLTFARPQGRDTAGEVVTTRAMQEIAQGLAAGGPGDVPLTFVEHTLTVQFYLNRHQLVVSPARAARLLLGDAACLLVTRDLPAIRKHLPADFEPVVVRSASAGGRPVVWLVTNRRDSSAPGGPTALGVGPLTVRLEGASLVEAHRLELLLRRGTPDARVEIVNDSAAATPAAVRWVEPADGPALRRTLAAGEHWSLPAR
jgi:4-amino-4-deoxy-L-arabinose transferase-like glycosyltransferase